jgi:preprotein translocase subunit SecD
MSRRGWNWIIIIVALGVALVNPLYRQFGLKPAQPIVTLGLDLRGGVEVLLQAVHPAGTQLEQDQMDGVALVVRNRVDPQGQKEISLSQVGQDRLLLQVPGEKNPDAIIEIIGETAQLEFINTGSDHYDDGTDLNDENGVRKPEFAKYETILTGADLAKSFPDFGQNNQPVIGFEFKQAAADKFGEFTNNHVGQYLTVALDGKVLTSPSIDEAIWGGRGIIRGKFSMAEVDKVVRQLNAGALPVPLSVMSSSVVGPTLGQESIDSSYYAGLIGFALVLIFMIVFYRMPGVVATIALALYVVYMMGYLSLMNATLTLPGIAGFLLSIGMAIDGNIIIFERLKEELRWGKTLVAAMDAAFNRAWVAILDGNLTTLIAAAVLFFFGTGPIKGFAVTLGIGNIISLFSAVFVTRNMMEVIVRNVRNIKLYA